MASPMCTMFQRKESGDWRVSMTQKRELSSLPLMKIHMTTGLLEDQPGESTLESVN